MTAVVYTRMNQRRRNPANHWKWPRWQIQSDLPLLALEPYVEDVRETIIIVKEINPLMDPYIHISRPRGRHAYSKRNVDQSTLIGLFPIVKLFVIDNYHSLHF